MSRTATALPPRLLASGLLRPLLLVVGVLALLGTGGVEVAPRATGTPAVSVLASAAGPAALRAPAVLGAPTALRAPAAPRGPVHGTDSQGPGSVSRAGYALTSVPSSGGADLPPAAGPSVAIHLTADPPSRPSAAPHLAADHDPAPGRAPPTTTGT